MRRERIPRHRLQRKPLVSNPGMHHGTRVTHVPWSMSGSLTRGGGENVPGIPGACASRNFTYQVRGPWVVNAVKRLQVRGIQSPLPWNQTEWMQAMYISMRTLGERCLVVKTRKSFPNFNSRPRNIWWQCHCHSPHQSSACHPGSRKRPPH